MLLIPVFHVLVLLSSSDERRTKKSDILVPGRPSSNVGLVLIPEDESKIDFKNVVTSRHGHSPKDEFNITIISSRRTRA